MPDLLYSQNIYALIKTVNDALVQLAQLELEHSHHHDEKLDLIETINVTMGKLASSFEAGKNSWTAEKANWEAQKVTMQAQIDALFTSNSGPRG